MSDESILSILAAGPIASGRLAEMEHTFCEDCACWVDIACEKGLCNSKVVQSYPHPSDGSWGPMRTAANGPMWPGCRGFCLRPGAPGPRARAREAAKEALAEARKRYREAKRKKAQ